MSPSHFRFLSRAFLARRSFLCAGLALLLLMGPMLLVQPAVSAHGLTISVGEPPVLSYEEEKGAPSDFLAPLESLSPRCSVAIVLHFKDANLQTIDFARYQAPATQSGNQLIVQVAAPDSPVSYQDALQFAVYDHYAAFNNKQEDITAFCDYDSEDGVVRIPLSAFESFESLAIVYGLSPLHPAYQRYVLNELDTASVSVHHHGKTATLHSDIADVLASAKGEPGIVAHPSIPLARLAATFPGASNKHYQLNTYTRLENFDVDMKRKQAAYGFPAGMIGSYGFGAFFGSRQVYEDGASTGTTWEQSVLKPSSSTYDATVDALLGETIAARLGSRAEFAISRQGEDYRQYYLTTGESFQDAGYSAGTAPNNKAMAHGACGSAGVANGGGAIMMDNAGDNYITYKGIYQGPESEYVGWYKFFYKFDAKSASTGQSFQDVVGYVLTPPLKRGSGQAIKVSANPAISNSSNRYSLKNAVIAVYTERAQAQSAFEKAVKKPWATWQEAREWAEAKAAFVFVTKSDGKSNIVEDLEEGTYYAAELFAPPGFRLFEGVKTLTIQARDNDTPDTVTFVDEPQRGSIDLVKVSANPGVSEDNPCYLLAHAVYTVYTEPACLNAYGSMTVAASSGNAGEARINNVPIGPYWVRETTRPARGFGIDDRIYPVAVVDGETTRVNTTEVSDPPKLDPIEIMIQKIDRHTGQPAPQGGASLGDTHFRISYYAVENAAASALEGLAPTASWVVRTNDQGRFPLQQAEQSFVHRSTRGPEQSLPYKVSGPAFHKLRDGSLGMPIGTYTIQEVKAPEGYLLDPTVHVRHINDEASNAEALTTFHATEAGDHITEAVVRSDIRFAKRANGSTRLAGIPFKLTSKTTGEWHILVTDKNGLASTESSVAKPHSLRTNANDTLFRNEDGSFALPPFVNTEALDGSAGVWFAGAKEDDTGAPVSDTQGALPFDIYLLEELRCPANQPFSLISDEVIVDASDQATTIDLGTLNNTMEGAPAIHTEAYNGLAGNLANHTLNAEGETLVIDRVNFSGLTAGQEYTLEAVLMNSATGDPFQAAGEEVRNTVAFMPQASSGFVNVPLSFDASGVTETTQMVVFETLRCNGVEEASHRVLEDAKQTLTVRPVAIETSACDSETGAHEAVVGENATIVDTVCYRGLTPGREYTLCATLMNAETGEVFEAEGEAVTAEQSFTPEDAAGSLAMSLSFPTEQLTETTALVVFETLYFNQAEVALHADLTNTDQTVTYSLPQEPEPEEPPTTEEPEPEEPSEPDEPEPKEPEEPTKTGKNSPRTPLSQTADQLAPIARVAGAALLGSAFVLALLLAVRRRRT